ncbi:nickel pincer cofactor biosynthesis protein LarB [Magnetofaba australis]|uniref:Putative 1-(5-phosphoribosyl)-5-amino-4-imidazole-carboxylate (AIR) carboxylase n=1 Tax=Magnetofaba australis IT-1 TaxID=1434232 RepID=A0A1Y2K7G9_9PROT|nr:nickel pincer cofactor biosynthesis protein LarB [Magnetofaba australis]OSM06267.1 putative 1-(5-phosphoribosyl)-5-amino-4-imidazole-carboxylate (AIR) carboxylase [Magnetofaba australis IT-1]
MNSETLRQLLEAVAAGHSDVDAAMARLKGFPADPVAHGADGVVARIDTQRELRHGFPEVILAEGKRDDHLQAILTRALPHDRDLLVTRVAPERAAALLELFPQLHHNATARCLYRETPSDIEPIGLVAVLCAGTSDAAVAEEAALTARMLGARVQTHYDAGVAGLHRLLAAHELLQTAHVFVVAAGMEGALPSVVGGLVDKPVIAVPTSVGYGASFGGLSALLGMLNSCSANVTVQNIDNGFGAGYVAGLINRLAASTPPAVD